MEVIQDFWTKNLWGLGMGFRGLPSFNSDPSCSFTLIFPSMILGKGLTIRINLTAVTDEIEIITSHYASVPQREE